jgi:uncharacterized damage-inducible protein DinB
MSEALLELYRHKTWATLRLIEHCQGLDDKDLDATIPGTYGTIRETLQHLVGAEESYFATLTRDPFRTKKEADAYVRADKMSDDPVPLKELAERIRRLGPRWEAVAEDADLPGRETTSTDGWRQPGSVLMAQAIHHADDHRTHVLSILGARGLGVPDLDVWSYAESAGQAHEPDKTWG